MIRTQHTTEQCNLKTRGFTCTEHWTFEDGSIWFHAAMGGSDWVCVIWSADGEHVFDRTTLDLGDKPGIDEAQQFIERYVLPGPDPEVLVRLQSELRASVEEIEGETRANSHRQSR